MKTFGAAESDLESVISWILSVSRNAGVNRIVWQTIKHSKNMISTAVWLAVLKRANECFTRNKNTISVQNRTYNGVFGNNRLIFIWFLAKIEHDACINTLRVFCLNIVRLIGFSVLFGFFRLGVLLLVYVLVLFFLLCGYCSFVPLM